MHINSSISNHAYLSRHRGRDEPDVAAGGAGRRRRQPRADRARVLPRVHRVPDAQRELRQARQATLRAASELYGDSSAAYPRGRAGLDGRGGQLIVCIPFPHRPEPFMRHRFRHRLRRFPAAAPAAAQGLGTSKVSGGHRDDLRPLRSGLAGAHRAASAAPSSPSRPSTRAGSWSASPAANRAACGAPISSRPRPSIGPPRRVGPARSPPRAARRRRQRGRAGRRRAGDRQRQRLLPDGLADVRRHPDVRPVRRTGELHDGLRRRGSASASTPAPSCACGRASRRAWRSRAQGRWRPRDRGQLPHPLLFNSRGRLRERCRHREETAVHLQVAFIVPATRSCPWSRSAARASSR